MDSIPVIGETFCHYRIVERIGAGGMGEVFRARDTKLNRDVALKVLPEVFARDAERMARFRREAQVLASLNHPNIATIHGLEESNGHCALVMELVEGPTLAERIRGSADVGAVREPPLQLDESLHIAKQIGEGLEYAHERGIIHRDLKPANVKVRPDGTVKILDFGLAKALEETPAAVNISDSPTISAAASREGMILGTAAYMSPEQARGKTVDRRCDIWSFGALLFEMLSGQQAFAGEDVSQTLATVIMKDPDWSVLPDHLPPSVGRLLRRSLEKDPRRRLQAIGEARILIEDLIAHPESAQETVAQPLVTQRPVPLWRRALPWGIATALALALAGMMLWVALRLAPRPPTRPIARLVVDLPPPDHLSLGYTPVLAMSPDGMRLVYVANRGASRQLYLRSLDRFEATPIPGTEGAETPFFSPDGQWVGFFADGKLKKVSVRGGAPLTLCSASVNRGASWGPDDTIIFTPSNLLSGLFRVSAGGGTPKPLTVPDPKKGEISHRWPQILPGGQAVLITIWTSTSFDTARIDLLTPKTGERRTLLEGGAYAQYVPSGHLVYARAGGLLAVPFDLKRLEVTGPPVPILEGVTMTSLTGALQVGTSVDGSLAYVPGVEAGVERTLVWVDRKGAPQSLQAPPRAYMSPRLSPDGQRVALAIVGPNPGVWLYEPAREALTRLIENRGSGIPWVVWTPDARRVTFASFAGGPWDIYWVSADGSGGPERLATGESYQWPGSWSPDGQVLAFSKTGPTTGSDIWVQNLKGERKPQPFLQTPANESGALFSPDGHWLAYESDESGRWEVYVRPFPGPGGKWQISTEGGVEPVWARNGRELFYRNGDKMMAAAVETKPTFAAAKPQLLFERHYEASPQSFLANYDVSPDGQRFLMVKAGEQESAATQINVVLNWADELRRIAPTGKP